ncbi:MAG: hypothetical protein Q7R87_04670 [Nanoarchaeota archaeon]|nr:hypothetical protein [Nanoarchaeota archaeon]
MGFGKGVLIVVLSFLLILTSFSLSLVIGANLLLEPETYEQTFEENNVYEGLHKQFFSSNHLLENRVDISPKDMKNTVNGLIGSFLAYAKGENDSIYLYMNNKSLKNFLVKQLDSVRSCEVNEAQFDVNNKILCKASGRSSEELLDEMLERKNMTHILAVDKVDLFSVIGGDQEFQKVQRFTVYYYNSIFILSVLLMGLILLIFLVNKDDFRKGLRINGISIFIAGLIAVLTVKFVNYFLLRYINLSPDIVYLQDTMLDLVNEVLSVVNIIGICAMVLELIIIGIDFFMKKKNENKEKKN